MDHIRCKMFFRSELPEHRAVGSGSDQRAVPLQVSFNGFFKRSERGKPRFDLRLRDAQVLTNVGNRALFAQALFAMAETKSTKEAVQAVAQAIAEAAPSEMDTPMLTPMVKRAMSKSIEEKGVIDVKDVAEEVFRSDPEREAIIEQVARQIQEEQLEPVIPVENKRVVAQLQRVKIKTDTGISITLPRELADDENSFAVVENGDGTISIIINKVQELKTE